MNSVGFIGLLILKRISEQFPGLNFGLYREDILNRIRKDIEALLKRNLLKITMFWCLEQTGRVWSCSKDIRGKRNKENTSAFAENYNIEHINPTCTIALLQGHIISGISLT